MARATKIMGAILIASAPLLLIIAFLSQGYLDQVKNVFEGGKEVSCTVEVDGLTSPSINQVSCSEKSTCFFSLQPLGFFSEKYSLEMWHSGVKYDEERFSVSALNDDATVELKGCLPRDASQVRIDYYNDDGGIIESKVVNI